MHNHEMYMLRCIELACKGEGMVAPNPMVGSVLVHENQIIGEGWHQKYGAAHAEVNAIESVNNKALIASSTLYVNLEPCSHFGKTPPCVNLIIENKIPRVVIGITDPFEKVSGKGIQILKDAGVEVITDVLKQDCEYVNRRFIKFVTQKQPYVILKWAQTKDGFIAPNASELTASEFEIKRHITGFVVQKLVHKWRSEEDSILVGNKTIISDNPALNVRVWNGRNPLRITIDKDNKLNAGGYKFFDGQQPSLIFCEKKPNRKIANLEYVIINFEKAIWPQILSALYDRNIQSLIIEGGRFTLNSIVRTKFWDEAQVFTTDALLNNGVEAPIINGNLVSESIIDKSYLRIYQNA
jgi:diaminohydroxyphosphoribosylaminopyrimidine deaminase/5-amino-6-(5-phosphoribosylamino)uracil reductase